MIPKYGLPGWFYSSYKTGILAPVLEAYLNRIRVFPITAEVIKYKSAWRVSRHIRQCLYYIMGLPEVTEILRTDNLAELTRESVCSFRFKSIQPGAISIRDECFSTKDKYILPRLVLEVLKCDDIFSNEEFNTLRDDLKLPIAATIYWYKELILYLESRKNLVMCLLISFLTCSDDIRRQEARLEKITRDDKSLMPLHFYAQWQCVYYDTMCLNSLAREPFVATSPARLYSGEVAMYYAITSAQNERWLDNIISRDSNEWVLLNQLLYLVTGCNEY